MEDASAEFTSVVALCLKALGKRAFRPAGSLNAAVFDSVTVGIARRLDKGKIKKPEKLAAAYEQLLKKESYLSAVTSATSDEQNVTTRLKEATDAFADVE